MKKRGTAQKKISDFENEKTNLRKARFSIINRPKMDLEGKNLFILMSLALKQFSAAHMKHDCS